MKAPALSVLVAGVCSPVGLSVARRLATEGGIVTCLVDAATGARLADESGRLTDLPQISFVTSDPVAADAVVIATDVPPPAQSVDALLRCCTGVQHAVLLSRIGAGSGSHHGMAKWRAAEEAAEAAAIDLTILRCGTPLGRIWALDELPAEVCAGDGPKGVTGTSRCIVSAAVATAVRRGAPSAGHEEFSVVSREIDAQRASDQDSDQGAQETAASWDALFVRAGGAAAANAHGAPPAHIDLDVTDPRLAAFTELDVSSSVAAPLPAALLYQPPNWVKHAERWATLGLLLLAVVESFSETHYGWCTSNPIPTALRRAVPDVELSCIARFPAMMELAALTEALY
jgi:hypothetical protein